MEVDAEALAEGFSAAFLGVLAVGFAGEDEDEDEDDAAEAFGDEDAEAGAESLYFFN